MIEIFTGGSSQSIGKRTFYLKDGKKVATIESFEEGEGENAHFVERVSYYDEKEKPVASKKKTAPYEEDLEFESYSLKISISSSNTSERWAITSFQFDFAVFDTGVLTKRKFFAPSFVMI